MIYEIKHPTNKEWNDKKFVEAYLKPENGEEVKVSAWNGEFTNEDGSFKPTIDVELYKNEKGYWAISKPKKAAGGAYMLNQKAQQIEQAQERKEASINRAMDRKEQSIAWFNSRNTAIEFVKVYVVNPQVSSVAEALEAVEKYTKIFYKQWENWDSQPF